MLTRFDVPAVGTGVKADRSNAEARGHHALRGAVQGHQQLHLGFPRIPDVAWASGMVAACLSAVGGAVALRYWVLARETARAVRVRLTRKRAALSVARLKRERAKIFDALAALTDTELTV